MKPDNARKVIKDLAEGSVNLKLTGGFTGDIEENTTENFRDVSNMTYTCTKYVAAESRKCCYYSLCPMVRTKLPVL